MHDKYLEALAASIKAWKAKLTQTDPRKIQIWGESCLCCQVSPNCDGCLIAGWSGYILCTNTPYYETHNAFDRWIKDDKDDSFREAFHSKAQAMIDYMEKIYAYELSKLKETNA